MKKQRERRIWSLDRLPMPRAFMHGPRWRRAFEVREVPAQSIEPFLQGTLLVFTFEPDVRELILEELRPFVFAQWSDPRDWLLPVRHLTRQEERCAS